MVLILSTGQKGQGTGSAYKYPSPGPDFPRRPNIMPLGDAISCPLTWGSGNTCSGNCGNDHGSRPTEVWFVSGKAANKAARDRLQTLKREEANLSENKENIPPDVEKAGPQLNKSEKT